MPTSVSAPRRRWRRICSRQSIRMRASIRPFVEQRQQGEDHRGRVAAGVGHQARIRESPRGSARAVRRRRPRPAPGRRGLRRTAVPRSATCLSLKIGREADHADAGREQGFGLAVMAVVFGRGERTPDRIRHRHRCSRRAEFEIDHGRAGPGTGPPPAGSCSERDVIIDAYMLGVRMRERAGGSTRRRCNRCRRRCRILIIPRFRSCR